MTRPDPRRVLRLGENLDLGLAAVLGGLLALARYGPKILDPLDHGWLFARPDSATNLLGWWFFRQDAWAFPPGRILGYLAPAGTAVGFTDSIPLLAIPFKAISFLLPDGFHYFGLWILICYCLQGFFGYLLARTLVDSRPLRFLFALVFLVSPVFLHRSSHFALSAHWVVLAALWLYFDAAAGDARRWSLRWLLLLALCSGIHPYLTCMVLGIAVASLVRARFLAGRLGWGNGAALAAALVGVVLAGWYLAGYFLGGGPAGAARAGYALSSLNLNAPWNPLETSLLWNGLPTAIANPFEGYGYFGAGVLGLVLLGLGLLVKTRPSRTTVMTHLPLLIVLVLFTGFALGNRIAWGEHVVLQYGLPGWLESVFSPFRASGRFFWPVYYGVVAFLLLAVGRRWRPRVVLGVVVPVLLLQVVDMVPILPVDHGARRSPFTSRLQSPAWREAARHFDRVLTYPPYLKTTDFENDFRDIALYAVENDMTTSAGYVARRDQQDVAAEVAELRTRLFEAQPDPRALYILRRSYFSENYARMQDRFVCTQLDGYQVCFSRRSTFRPDRAWVVREYPLADYLRRVLPHTVLIAVKEDAAVALPEPARQLLRDLGSRIDQLRPGGSYAAIIQRGQILFEQLDADQAIVATAERGSPVGHLVLDEDWYLMSAGVRAGDAASIGIGEAEWSFNRRGINLVVMNDRQEVTEVATFDTHVMGDGFAFVMESTGVGR